MADLPVGDNHKIIIAVTGLVFKSFTGTILNTARGLTSENTPEVPSNTEETNGNYDTFKIRALKIRSPVTQRCLKDGYLSKDSINRRRYERLEKI